MIVNERDVRVALAGIIAAAVPLGLVYNRWVLAFDPGQWAGLLRSPADAGRVNSWMVTRRAVAQEKIGNNCVRAVWHYDVIGYYGYATGNDTASSEDQFQADVDAVCKAVADAALDPAIGRNDQVQFPAITIEAFGGELVHVARGRLSITPCLH
jgi:hypothetical protein